MSDRAREYVRDLGPNRLTPRQKQMLGAIAEHYSDRYRSANVALESLCSEILTDRRYGRRIIRQLVDLGELDYFPGRGSGNFSRFNLPRFEKEREKGAERGLKGGFCDARNKEENLNLNLQPPQTPPSAKEGLRDRDRRELMRLLQDVEDGCYRASIQGVRVNIDWLLEAADACARLGIDTEAAFRELTRHELWRARLGMEKPPERAIA